MAKEVFNDYAAYETPGGLRYQHNGKLIGKAAVPIELLAYFDAKFAVRNGGERGRVEETQRPRITPEESARLKAETTAVRPDLQMTPEQIEERTITEEDFETPITDGPSGPHTISDIDPRFIAPPKVPAGPTVELQAVANDTGQTINSDFLESVSIHTASIYDIAEALYNRFGLYSVYLRRLPLADETNPLTGELFTNYHLGIAYQAAIRAQNQGVLERDPRLNRDQLDNGRAASENFQDQFVPQPKTMGEARRQNSFDYRTSVRGANEQTDPNYNGANQKYSDDQDEMVVEPAFGKQVINPHWAD